MISWLKGSLLGRSNKGVVINVQHALTRADMVTALRIVKEESGADVAMSLVHEALGTKADIFPPNWAPGEFYCFVQDGQTPRYPHATYARALIEAKRLLDKTGKETYVMKRVAMVSVKSVATVEVTQFGLGGQS